MLCESVGPYKERWPSQTSEEIAEVFRDREYLIKAST
jgi:hypothetical protein